MNQIFVPEINLDAVKMVSSDQEKINDFLQDYSRVRNLLIESGQFYLTKLGLSDVKINIQFYNAAPSSKGYFFGFVRLDVVPFEIMINCWHYGVDTITLRVIECLIGRVDSPDKVLAHEISHIHQYVTSNLSLSNNRDICYNSKQFSRDLPYHERPWEQDAVSLSDKLYQEWLEEKDSARMTETV